MTGDDTIPLCYYNMSKNPINKEEAKMNKSRLSGGIICLALAGLLAVLNVVLPADKLMFTVSNTNMPLVPPIILAVVGLGLLITAGKR